MLELHAFPKIKEKNLIFQQEEAPSHYIGDVCDFIDEKFPIGLEDLNGRIGHHAYLTLDPCDLIFHLALVTSCALCWDIVIFII